MEGEVTVTNAACSREAPRGVSSVTVAMSLIKWAPCGCVEQGQASKASQVVDCRVGVQHCSTGGSLEGGSVSSSSVGTKPHQMGVDKSSSHRQACVPSVWPAWRAGCPCATLNLSGRENGCREPVRGDSMYLITTTRESEEWFVANGGIIRLTRAAAWPQCRAGAVHAPRESVQLEHLAAPTCHRHATQLRSSRQHAGCVCCKRMPRQRRRRRWQRTLRCAWRHQ